MPRKLFTLDAPQHAAIIFVQMRAWKENIFSVPFIIYFFLHYEPVISLFSSAESLMDTHRSNMTLDDSDTESKNLTAVKSKSGELKFISGAEDSEDDLLQSSKT